MAEPQTLVRNAGVEELVAVLRTNHARKIDIVAPVSHLSADAGRLVVSGGAQILTEDGVTSADGVFLPTLVADGGIADRLGIPPGYLTRCRNTNLQTYDDNVNGWLRHDSNQDKLFLVRGFRDDTNPDGGIARAFLSNSYKPIDDLDVLMTVIEGINEAGVQTQIAGCHLTDRRMYAQFTCEDVAINAAELVRGYRYGGRTGEQLPMVFAGFEVSNSEVGLGAMQFAPRIVFQVCTNGQTVRMDAFRAQHLGVKLEAGAIDWSTRTQDANLALIRSMTVDSVRKFLSPQYVQALVDGMTAKAATPVSKPQETVQHVVKTLRYSEAQQDAILAAFINGGISTAGGVMHAVTAVAQAHPDADLAADLEADSFQVLDLAAAFARAHA